MGGALLELRGLKAWFHTDEGVVKAVDDVSLTIGPGECVGLVGESGSGKSVTSLAVMRLLPEASAEIAGGTISFVGRDLAALSTRQMCSLRGAEMAMIFQEPMTSLNPVYRVGDQVIEAIRAHSPRSYSQARARTIELFREVGIPDPMTRIDSYPHEMSGGQKQRVMIAMALACDPKLLICDEPTTALDVTIQAQILDLLRHLRDSRGMAMLFITHDLGVIAEIADRVAVMYRGRLVEYGDVLDVFERPAHPYTKGLLMCKPRLETSYDVLPTVDDFMESRGEGEHVEIVAKAMNAERLAELTGAGRKRNIEPAGEPLLEVKGLTVEFKGRAGLFGVAASTKAVDDVSFAVWPGQTLGLVGESGCGKTTTGRAILGLIPATRGAVTFRGVDLCAAFDAEAARQSRTDRVFGIALFVLTLIVGYLVTVITGALFPEASFLFARLPLLGVAALDVAAVYAWVARASTARSLRADVQIVFQDPYSSLNPRQTVESILTEPMAAHSIGVDHADRVARAAKLLDEVGLKSEYLRRYPHEFSGGQRQRICIARALAVQPKIVICDEAVSALDVSVQAQVLNLLRKLQKDRGLTYIFISHDLSVVKFMSDTMAVMQAGRIVEMGPSEAIYANPAEAYTRRLIAAIPRDDATHIRALHEARRAARAAEVAR